MERTFELNTGHKKRDTLWYETHLVLNTEQQMPAASAALMQDQVAALRGKVQCAHLCSSMSEKEKDDIKGRLL